ncbi:hypothetical protein DFA_09507 [Cavenderia fasciculata]|uniref:Methyltransferase type 11 domain-containing protein n=1 Tax=Cavenderia fasciculata TaxID=261658 RepID=F4Q7T8_CACFS|nr:uncharacterized protein DFA_09507 [Cavenderia fasciculata]EGG15838.1 hypothetical protein DFA_09507 [Cavenderia fasciculata]|eukprot:XP_004352163.1 hypothetical protein DFA_09507 [Cavenderia fasciculata]
MKKPSLQNEMNDRYSLHSTLLYVSTTTMTKYGESDYWDKRYSKNTNPYDWYQDYDDISKIVIDQMSTRYKDYVGLEYKVESAIETSFKDNHFNVIIDKGTFDSIMCGDDSHENGIRFCEEMFRILEPAGKFLIITYGVPDDRLFYLEQEYTDWTINVKKIPNGGGFHYVYIMTKNNKDSAKSDDDE